MLVQAALGGAPNNVIGRFPGDSWLDAPTPNMGVFEVTPEQLERLIKMTEERCAEVS